MSSVLEDALLDWPPVFFPPNLPPVVGRVLEACRQLFFSIELVCVVPTDEMMPLLPPSTA